MVQASTSSSSFNGGAPVQPLQEAARTGAIQADDLALATSAREPIIIHDPQEAEFDSRGTPNEDINNKNVDLEEKGSVEKPDAVPSIDAEQEGGKYGVRAVIGGFGVSLCTWGMSGSWSVLQDTYERNQLSNYSSSEIAWIGSAQTCMIYASSAVAGRLFDEGYMSHILLFACLSTTTSFMLASISTQYWHFLLSQGFLMGIGLGAGFSPSLACVSSYYRRRRAIASGLLSAGSAFGGLILPIVQSKMINNPKIGLGWALRMTGFLALLFQGTAWLIMKQKKTTPSKRPLFDVSVYHQKAYAVTAVALFFTTMSMFFPVFYIQPFAVAKGVSESLVFYSIAILNGASIFGRIFPSLIADKFGPYNVMNSAVAVQCILIYGFTGIHNFAGVAAFSALNGIAYGCYVTINPVALAFMSDTPARIGTHIGMAFMTNSIAALAGPPALGAIITATGEYWQAAIVAATCSLCSCGLLILSRRMLARTRGTWKV